MLFRTVYGPELQSMYEFIKREGVAEYDHLRHWFIQTRVLGNEDTNLEDCLGFLQDVGLIDLDCGVFRLSSGAQPIDFRLLVLQRLQAICRENRESHPLDPWFMRMLDLCFIKQDRIHVQRFHSLANHLQLPVPCSEERANAWRRVMEFLGCGRRTSGGFWAHYSPDLVLRAIVCWGREGPLEKWASFAESYIPVFTRTGGMARALASSLLQLEENGAIQLRSRADYPGRAYMGERRIKWLVVRA